MREVLVNDLYFYLILGNYSGRLQAPKGLRMSSPVFTAPFLLETIARYQSLKSASSHNAPDMADVPFR